MENQKLILDCFDRLHIYIFNLYIENENSRKETLDYIKEDIKILENYFNSL